MELRKEDLEWAAEQGLVDRAQVEPLWEALAAREATAAPRSRFDLVHIAYYFGALIVIGAMGFFMTLGWESFGGRGLFAISAAYAGVFVVAGRSLWRRPETRVPGGLLFTMAVCMTPLAAYGLERAVGLWPTEDPGVFHDFHVYIRSGWLWMELATVIAAGTALRFVRFPFLTAPLAFVVWYMSMDLAPAILGRGFHDNERELVSVAVGFVMLGVAFLVDRRTRDDYAFWGYLFGLLAFWGGLSAMHSDSEINKLLYCLLNVGLIVVSALLERRVFAVFGGLGVFGYLSYLSWHVFKDSVAFPFALSFLGIAILASAVKYARNQVAIERWVREATPSWLVRVTPRARHGK